MSSNQLGQNLTDLMSSISRIKSHEITNVVEPEQELKKTLPPPTILNLKFIQKNATEIKQLKQIVKVQDNTINFLHTQLERQDVEITTLRLQFETSGIAMKRQLEIKEAKLNEKKQKLEHLVPLDTNDIANFLQAWETKYLCSHFLQNKCKFHMTECRHIHNETDREIIVSELKHIASNSDLYASKFFQQFWNSNMKMKCFTTIQYMKDHVKSICGIF